MNERPQRKSSISMTLEVLGVIFVIYLIGANLSRFEDPLMQYNHGLMGILDMLGSLICISFYRAYPTTDRMGTIRFWSVVLFGLGCQEAWIAVRSL